MEIKEHLELLDKKFEKVRKAIIEQHSRIDPIQNELLGNRNEYHIMMEALKQQNQRMQKVESENKLILQTLKTLSTQNEKKGLAYFLKSCYTKFVNIFS